jgi:hypothetical protein
LQLVEDGYRARDPAGPARLGRAKREQADDVRTVRVEVLFGPGPGGIIAPPP